MSAAHDSVPPLHNTVEVRVRDSQALSDLGFYRELRTSGFRSGIDNINDPRFQAILLDARWDRATRSLSKSPNIRVYMGRDNWQRLGMFGDITANATGYTGVTGAATATSSTTLTNSGAAFPTSGGVNGSLQGHVVYCPVAGVYGVVVSNTATQLTVDQWTSMTSALGAAGTTPASTAVYAITPGAGIGCWIGLSSNNATPSEMDVPLSSSGLFGTGSASGTATEYTNTSAPGLGRQFVQPTFPSPGNVALATTFTYTGSTTGINVYTALLYNAKAAAGNLLILESNVTVATFNASGDNMTLTWSISLGS